jgi:anti-sigma regulatory factor (Ser/Thr protein kinase)
MHLSHKISGGDFAKAGTVASSVKKVLRQMNIDPHITKRVVIAVYECEVNVVAHAYSGTAEIEIDNEKVIVTISDSGPGIEDISRAMEEGYSTASEHVREMGFGAGMGLANIKKNSDRMQINSIPGKGTTVELLTFINKPEKTSAAHENN